MKAMDLFLGYVSCWYHDGNRSARQRSERITTLCTLDRSWARPLPLGPKGSTIRNTSRSFVYAHACTAHIFKYVELYEITMVGTTQSGRTSYACYCCKHDLAHIV